jgi:hypothetical protein
MVKRTKTHRNRKPRKSHKTRKQHKIHKSRKQHRPRKSRKSRKSQNMKGRGKEHRPLGIKYIASIIENAIDEKSLYVGAKQIISYLFAENRDYSTVDTRRKREGRPHSIQSYRELLLSILHDITFNKSIDLDTKKSKFLHLLDSAYKTGSKKRTLYITELIQDLDDEYAELVGDMGDIIVGDAKTSEDITYTRGNIVTKI